MAKKLIISDENTKTNITIALKRIGANIEQSIEDVRKAAAERRNLNVEDLIYSKGETFEIPENITEFAKTVPSGNNTVAVGLVNQNGAIKIIYLASLYRTYLAYDENGLSIPDKNRQSETALAKSCRACPSQNEVIDLLEKNAGKKLVVKVADKFKFAGKYKDGHIIGNKEQNYYEWDLI